MIINDRLLAYLGNDINLVEEDNDEELRIWYSPSKKQTILIKDMDNVYIHNCINMLNSKGITKPNKEMLAKKDTYIRWFNEELGKRVAVKPDLDPW